MLDLVRRFANEAPAATDARHDKPTLLVCWWCTIYALFVILTRLIGRWVRAEKVFLDDGVMMFAIIPLILRMGLVHIVLKNGTNNTIMDGLSDLDISRRELGSQVVLVARIMYAAYLWAIKYSVSVFLRTLTGSVWQRRHARFLHYLHFFLLATFLATVVADLSACQPFSHYWQVIPDPGPQCRQNYAHLLVTGIMDAITNLALVVFPIPMILGSRLTKIRKFSILVRLALPLLPIILTVYALRSIIAHQGQQAYRSLLASFSLLLTTFTSNAVVLSSLIHNRGYKKSKFKHVVEIAGLRSPLHKKSMGGLAASRTTDDDTDDEDGLLRKEKRSERTLQEGHEMAILRKSEVDVRVSIRSAGDSSTSEYGGGDGSLNDFHHTIALQKLPPARLGDIRIQNSWEVSVAAEHHGDDRGDDMGRDVNEQRRRRR